MPRRAQIHMGFRGMLLAAVGLAAVAQTPGFGQDAASIWDQSDPDNTASIDHGDWQAVLDAYLITDDPSGVNMFDYGALKASEADRQRLAGYLTDLQGMDPREFARDEQMAYWINLYNAITVRVVVDAYPVESIMLIYEGEGPAAGPWKAVNAHVAGNPLTLDNIEHDILRPIWQDNRIHYAVNCASIGCPNLAPEAYTAANLDRLMDQGAREFVNHVRGVELLDEAFGVTSSIYFWYMEDFGDSEEGVLEHFRKYAEGELADQLAAFDGSLDHEYDWRLNAPGSE